jgi:hypothetical protein
MLAFARAVLLRLAWATAAWLLLTLLLAWWRQG